MRIALIDNGLTVGGTLTMTANICRGLKDHANHQIKAIIAVDPSIAAPYFRGTANLELLRMPYHYMRSRALKRSFDEIPFFRSLAKPACLLLDAALQPVNRWYGTRLAQRLKKFEPDIIHMANGDVALDAVARLKIPIVFHLHGLAPPKIPVETLRSLDKVTHFVAISKVVKDTYVSAGIDSSKISIVSNFIIPRSEPTLTSNEARGRLGLAEQAEIIGFVGRIVPWKGPLEFVNAMSIVAGSRPNARFILVGDSTEAPEYVARLREQIRTLGLESRISFFEHLTDTYTAYRACSVFVHASIEPEPFGMVILEAMQAETPVVAAFTGGPTEIIENGASGLLVNPQDANALSSAVMSLIDDHTLRQSIISGAIDRVARYFSVKTAVQGITHTYEHALHLHSRQS